MTMKPDPHPLQPLRETVATSEHYDFTYLSFGAGVQSTTLLVISNLGRCGCPRADIAIFADTQCEPPWVYDNLKFMDEWSRIPIVRVTAGDLGRDFQDWLSGERRRTASIPAWTRPPTGKAAPLRRACTRDYKVRPIERKVRELPGYRTPKSFRRHRKLLHGSER
jgi:hypothetical protein